MSDTATPTKKPRNTKAKPAPASATALPPGIATGSRSMTAHPRWASAARDERIAALA